MKKKLLITAAIVLTLLAGAATVRWWLNPSLRWLGVNSELLQGLDALIQIFLSVGAGIAIYVKLLRKLTARRVHKACRAITRRRAKLMIDGRSVIERPDLDQELDEFLSSDYRYGFAIGASGVGKTIAMAAEGRRLLDRGWTVLLLRGRSFTVASALEELAHELQVAPNTLSWSTIAEFWTCGTKASSGFVLMIDPLDLTAIDAIDRELELLHDAIGTVAPERVKVIASARDTAWERFHDLSSFTLYEPTGGVGRKSGRSAELCKLLWIAGDNRAEHALIRKLEAPVSTARAAWYERNSVVRALGTCGSRGGAQAVISYVRSEKEISIYFDEQTLFPLLRRKIISADEIVDVARDSKVPAGGRIACLLALADLDASAHKDVFLDVAKDDDEAIQGYAVRMLGGTKDTSVAPFLRDRLRTSTSLRIRAQAAESLAWLDARETLPDIERAAGQGSARSFVGALAHFGAISSLPIVLDGLAKESPDERHDFLRAIGSFWKYPTGRQAVLGEFAKWSTGIQDWFDNQSSLIVGMVNHEPNECLKQFNTAYDNGHINPRARETMASRIPQLFAGGLVDRQLLKESIKRLVCDLHVPARERTVNALAKLDAAFCTLIYEELKQSATSERERACATYMLGFWSSDSGEIGNARFDGELLVRQAADAAREVLRLRTAITWHVQRFSRDDGLARLSSYLCLKEHAQLSTIWELNATIGPPSLSYAFSHELTTAIGERLKNDYRKKEDEEKKLEDSRGTVWFN